MVVASRASAWTVTLPGDSCDVSVVGISSSSRADLDRELAKLSTNLLTVAPGNTLMGGTATLPGDSIAMIFRIGPVRQVSAIGKVPDVNVYRSDRIPTVESGGLSVQAA